MYSHSMTKLPDRLIGSACLYWTKHSSPRLSRIRVLDVGKIVKRSSITTIVLDMPRRPVNSTAVLSTVPCLRPQRIGRAPGTFRFGQRITLAVSARSPPTYGVHSCAGEHSWQICYGRLSIQYWRCTVLILVAREYNSGKQSLAEGRMPPPPFLRKRIHNGLLSF